MARLRTLVYIDPLLDTSLLVIDENPTTGAGVIAGVGSIAFDPAGQVWQKVGAGDTAWALAGEGRRLANQVITSPEAGIGATDTSVATGAFDYQIGAADGIYNTFKKKDAVAAGTALAAGTIPADLWGVYLFSIEADGTINCAVGADNDTGYATEAAALAAVPATPADEAPVVAVTVLTADGEDFIANTDALEGGASGNPATTTNYYNFGRGAV